MMKPYVIYGGGAVGSALGAFLSRAGHSVTLVARPDHVAAIRDQKGIRAVTRSEDFLAPVKAVPSLPDHLPPDARFFLTVQSPDIADAVARTAPAAAEHPTVTWQNGIQAEAIAAPRFPTLYGGVVRFTATRLEPGEVRLRAPGKLILGRHPRGVDALAQTLVDELHHAGFEAVATPEIAADKALKLLVNLVSGPPVLLQRTGTDAVLAAVQVALLEEARTVFDRAGIPIHPASGAGQTVDELIEHFRSGGSPPDTTGGIYNSTWQNLYHRRPRLENHYYHGEVIRLGKTTGVPTPVNERALHLLESAQQNNLGPEPFDSGTFREKFADVIDLPSQDSGTPRDTEKPSSLEI